jgi:hypothetical protein
MLNEMATEVSPKYSFSFDTVDNMNKAKVALDGYKIPYDTKGDNTIHLSKRAYADVAQNLIGATQLVVRESTEVNDKPLTNLTKRRWRYIVLDSKANIVEDKTTNQDVAILENGTVIGVWDNDLNEGLIAKKFETTEFTGEEGVEDIDSMFQAAKSGLGTASKLKDQEDKKKHKSQVMTNLNMIRGKLHQMTTPIEESIKQASVAKVKQWLTIVDEMEKETDSDNRANAIAKHASKTDNFEIYGKLLKLRNSLENILDGLEYDKSLNEEKDDIDRLVQGALGFSILESSNEESDSTSEETPEEMLDDSTGDETVPISESANLSLEQFTNYVMNSYYVYGGNDEDDITIEDDHQKFRVRYNEIANEAEVWAEESNHENNKRAEEIAKDINTQHDWGQFEQLDENVNVDTHYLEADKDGGFNIVNASTQKIVAKHDCWATASEELTKLNTPVHSEIKESKYDTVEEGWCLVSNDSPKIVIEGPYADREVAMNFKRHVPPQQSNNWRVIWGKVASDGSGEYVATKAVNPVSESVVLPPFSQVLRYAGNNEGIAYLVHETIRAINSGKQPTKAFQNTCENQNFYGDRPDIIAARKKARDILRDKYRVNVGGYRNI